MLMPILTTPRWKITIWALPFPIRTLIGVMRVERVGAMWEESTWIGCRWCRWEKTTGIANCPPPTSRPTIRESARVTKTAKRGRRNQYPSTNQTISLSPISHSDPTYPTSPPASQRQPITSTITPTLTITIAIAITITSTLTPIPISITTTIEGCTRIWAKPARH